MSKTVRDQILDNVVTALQAITTANGYGFDVQSVDRYEAEGVNPAQLPAIIVIGGGQRLLTEESGRSRWELDVMIDCLAAHPADDSRTSDEIAGEFAGDVITALMADRTRGGLAAGKATEIVSIEPLPVVPGLEVTVTVTARIQFRHLATDPRDQGGVA